MSVKPLIGVWRDIVRDCPVLTWRGKVVAFTLSTYMNAKGRAYPSRATIAAGASIAVRTVDTALAELERAGLLLIERSRGRSSNTYIATVPPTAHDVHRSEWANGAARAANGAGDAANGAPRAPESAESAESVFQKRDERTPSARSKIYDEGIIE